MATINPEDVTPGARDLITHYKSITRWWSAMLNGQATGDYSNYNVLVADDEPLVCELTARTLQSHIGCNVQVAHSGGEALERIEQGHFEVLVTDMIMPGLNSLELIQKVRATYPDIAILVMTGFPDDFPFVDIIKAGANDFIVKPHAPQELEAKLIRIFEERRLRDAQIVAEAKYRSLFECSMDGMALIDPADSRVIEVNRAFANLCGRSREFLLQADVFALLVPPDHERLKYGLAVCEAEGQSALGDLGLLQADDRTASIDASLSYIAVPGQRYVLLVVKDVTEKRELERHLADAVERDELTGLSNKRRFRNRIEWAIVRALQEEMPLALIFVDLDNFKNCNDTYGHQIGDSLLRQVGQIVRNCIRVRIDEGFRFGGDEFAVLLYGANVAAAMSVAERMRSEFAAGNSYGTTISIGISQHVPPQSATEFIKRADDALYAAKSKGKNTIVVG
jgi:two-component system, cell cycle response regulator